MRKKVTKAIFPVAGMGTRFLPATKSVPKEIMTLVDRPLVQYAIDEARAAGIKEFIFVMSRGKSALAITSVSVFSKKSVCSPFPAER